jgi:glutathione synthase/RimK-type ligase-like ATP-grasp enzyme
VIDSLAWVTTRDARGTDDDEAPALAALAATGVRVEVVDWDDPDVRWAAFDRIALRSTWDYSQRLDEFLGWLDRVDAVTEVRNPAAVVRWNLDKHYLAELAGAGVPVIPTTFVEPGGPVAFEGGDFEGGVVVKPAVGAGSRDVGAYRADEHDLARAHVERLSARGASALVQPKVASVEAEGEWGLLFFGGRYSHAANKRIALAPAGVVDDLFVAEELAAHDAGEAQIAVAQAAVDVVAARFGTPAYARVDLVRGDDGGHQVLEVELVEPSLFLPQADAGAAQRLAAALVS